MNEVEILTVFAFPELMDFMCHESSQSNPRFSTTAPWPESEQIRFRAFSLGSRCAGISGGKQALPFSIFVPFFHFCIQMSAPRQLPVWTINEKWVRISWSKSNFYAKIHFLYALPSSSWLLVCTLTAIIQRLRIQCVENRLVYRLAHSFLFHYSIIDASHLQICMSETKIEIPYKRKWRAQE